jgi:Ca2+-transporting ATPase
MTDSMDKTKWYTLSTEDVAKQLQVDPAKGLSSDEAKSRQQKYGPNKLAEKKKKSGLQAFLEQYQDLMQFVLLGAAIINQIFTHEWGTTLVLVGLTVFNAILGMRGEAKAEASLAALSETMKSIARVRRNGQAVEINAEELIPGDIVLMEAGNRVPADGRLFVTATL